MIKKLYIFGAGSSAVEVAKLVEDINLQKKEWEILGFVVNKAEQDEDRINNIPILSIQEIKEKDAYSICSVLDPYLRKKIIETEIEPNGLKLTTIVHPNAYILGGVELGAGSIIYPRVTISHDVKFGKASMVIFNSMIGHEFVGGDYTTVCPGVIINGGCRVGNNSLIGSGSVIHQYLTIGENCNIGMGVSLFNSVESNKSVVTLPRIIEK